MTWLSQFAAVSNNIHLYLEVSINAMPLGKSWVCKHLKITIFIVAIFLVMSLSFFAVWFRICLSFLSCAVICLPFGFAFYGRFGLGNANQMLKTWLPILQLQKQCQKNAKNDSQSEKCKTHAKKKRTTCKKTHGKNAKNMRKKKATDSRAGKIRFLDFPGRLQIQPPAPDEKTTRKKIEPNDNKMQNQMTKTCQKNDKHEYSTTLRVCW